MPIDYKFTDKKVEADKTYFYYLEDIDIAGERSKSGIIKAVIPPALPIPSKFALLPNFPNPFNPETWIPYELASAVEVKLTIYNGIGQLIRTLELGKQPAGHYCTKAQAAYWDGRNEQGERVSNGLYFYHLSVGEFRATKKMLLLK